MIYFLQDDAVNLIKIGFTEGEAADRLKSLQTGSPAGLVMLCTLPGDKTVERELHARFASARERGEWFRPSPDLLRFLIEEAGIAGFNQGKSVQQIDAEQRLTVTPWPLKIYLAGKIEKNCWRHGIVDGLRGALDEGNCPEGYGDEAIQFLMGWPVLERSIFGTHHYVGPYFLSCDHGCWHGDDSHGAGLRRLCSKASGSHSPRLDVVNRCLEAIDKADLVFAWVASNDCYGTVAELGYAKALDKDIVIAGPRRFRDMWFVYQMADWSGRLRLDARVAFEHATARAALERFLFCIEPECIAETA